MITCIVCHGKIGPLETSYQQSTTGAAHVSCVRLYPPMSSKPTEVQHTVRLTHQFAVGMFLAEVVMFDGKAYNATITSYTGFNTKTMNKQQLLQLQDAIQQVLPYLHD